MDASRKTSEVLVLPATLVVLVVLSIFILFSYRNTVDGLLAERHREAETAARALARELAGGLPSDHELTRRRGAASAVAVLDAAGGTLVASGDYTGSPPPAEETSWWRSVTTPARRTVSATAPLPVGGRSLTLRVDLPAATLLSAARGLRILTPVVLVVDSALLLLMGLYLHQFLAPFDRLLRRARASGRLPAARDELSFLLETFEEAMETMAAPPDDLEALERTLTRSIESGLLLLDDAGDVLALNEVGAALLGVERPSPGTPLDELLAPHPAARAALAEAIAARRGLERRELPLGETGERTLGLTLHPLRRDDGAVRGYLAFFVDLTTVRRQAEERQLAASLQQIGELSAGVAHEMRNSLATLRGYLTLIERGGEGDDVSEYLEEMRRETDHLKRVVDDFLAFARPGSTRMEKVDLTGLLHRAAADPALAGMPVRFAGAAPARVDGDAQLLERAFRNLLHNAAEAERGAGHEGPLEVAIAPVADGVEVVIRDRGAGLPEEIRSRLFHPFATHRPGGVGLGLALTHRIVELHHGSVRLDDRDGGGTEARVRLRLDAGDASVTDRNDPN